MVTVAAFLVAGERMARMLRSYCCAGHVRRFGKERVWLLVADERVADMLRPRCYAAHVRRFGKERAWLLVA